jgi:hypothetical protein
MTGAFVRDDASRGASRPNGRYATGTHGRAGASRDPVALTRYPARSVAPRRSGFGAAYGLEFAQRRSMDPSLMCQAVASGAVDVIGAFSTDGRIAAYDLVVLEDARGAIPPCT